MKGEDYYNNFSNTLTECFGPISVGITNTIQKSDTRKIINLQIREKYYKPMENTVWQINSKDVVNSVESDNNGMYPTVKTNLQYNYTVPIPDSVYNVADLT